MGLTYILVDFENVQPQLADLALLRGEDFRVLVFHGAHQNKFDAEMVKALQPLGDRMEWVQSDRHGPGGPSIFALHRGARLERTAFELHCTNNS